jgi:hypothetical protein
MKKLLILTIALALGVGANAQIKYGVKAGLNLSSLSTVESSAGGISVNTLESDGLTAGFHVGGFVNFSFGGIIGLQPELLFSIQGGKQKAPSTLGTPVGDPSVDITFDYINVPVLLDIKPLPGLSILVGPQIGFNIYKSATNEGETISGSDFDVITNGSDGFNGIDFAAVIGAQYTFIGHLVLGARYNIGLTNTFSQTVNSSGINVDVTGWKNNVLQVSLGWIF